MGKPPSRRHEQQRLAAELRADGRTWAEIADVFQRRYGVGARAALRLVRGWSQARAAEEWSARWPDDVKVAKNFSHWETWPVSGHAPSLDILDRLAQLYECSVADLVGDLGDHRHLDHAREPGQPAGVDAAIAAPRRFPGVIGVGVSGPEGLQDDVGDSGGVVGRAVSADHPDPDGLEAVELGRRVEASDVGATTLAAIETGVDRLGRSYAHVAPAELLASLLRFQRYIGELLDSRMTLAQRRELLCQAGWLAILRATADIDLGYHRAAAANLDLARAVARETGDLSIAAWALETQAWHALSGGDPARATALCHEGLDYAPPNTSARVQLETQLARASARLGDVRTTQALVDRCAADVDRLPSAVDYQHHFVCDPQRVVGFCAAALVWLGDHGGPAEEYARRAVHQYEGADEPHYVHRLAVARLNLAIVLGRQGEPGEAAHLGHLAFDASWRLCRTDLFLATDLDRLLLGRYRGDADVASFHERYLDMRREVSSQVPRAGAPPLGTG